jgi:hypothetical protein
MSSAAGCVVRVGCGSDRARRAESAKAVILLKQKFELIVEEILAENLSLQVLLPRIMWAAQDLCR